MKDMCHSNLSGPATLLSSLLTAETLPLLPMYFWLWSMKKCKLELREIQSGYRMGMHLRAMKAPWGLLGPVYNLTALSR